MHNEQNERHCFGNQAVPFLNIKIALRALTKAIDML